MGSNKSKELGDITNTYKTTLLPCEIENALEYKPLTT